MHFSCRAIINFNNTILLIHRKKLIGDETYREYYVIPGGKQEKNETDEETLKREIIEEIGIKIEVDRLLFEYESEYDESIQKFYICNYISGKINTGTGPELKKLKENEIFEIEQVDKQKLKKIKLVPEEIEKSLKCKLFELYK